MAEIDYAQMVRDAEAAAATRLRRGVIPQGGVARAKPRGPEEEGNITGFVRDMLIPQTPADVALMIAGGGPALAPVRKLAGKIGAAALGTAGALLSPDEAQAKFRKLVPSAFKLMTGPKAPQEFHDAVKAIKEAHPQAAAVTLKTPEEYAQEGTKLFATKDKKATVAVMPDGDVVSVAKHPDAPYSGAGPAAAKRAVQEGGTKLDAYDTVLPDLYGKAGYKEVSRLPFDPKQAPSDWSTEAFSAFSGKTPTAGARMKNIRTGGPGEPDIVGMVANPPGRTSGVAIRDYGDMATLQRLAQEGRHPAEFIPTAKRAYYPSVYDDPRKIVETAVSRVGPEDPMLQRLWGVSRGDLYDMARAREQQHGLGALPGPPMAPTKGSQAAIEQITTPQNIQRYEDVLGEASKHPELMHGGYGWYIQDPMFQQMAKLIGFDNALREYPRLNAFQGSHSPASNVLTEIHRGTTAYQAAKQGWLPEYIQYGSKKAGIPIPEDIAARLEGVPGHLAHGAHTQGLEGILAGEALTAPKTTPYIQSSGVPQTGYSWKLPAIDAMMVRNIGIGDVRTPKTLQEQYGAVTPGELASLAPHWSEMSRRVGMNPVGAQGVGWTTFGPGTGVDTALGAPKLELQSQQIARRARETGKSPERVRDEGLQGLEHWMIPLLGPTAAAAYFKQSQAPDIGVY